jgi:nucleotide-binding universal stress UspA family protein
MERDMPNVALAPKSQRPEHADPAISIREVLFPCDMSPESERAFEHARFLAESFGARLTLYHAVEVPDPSYAHWAFNRGREIWTHVEHTARELIQRKADTLSIRHEVQVERTSSVPEALLTYIRSHQPDLTVMATHGREGLRHFLLGSVTESVFRHSFRPVLCVREVAHGGTLPYRRVLVPTDLSLASRLAFPMAAQIARRFSSEVLAVHVVGAGSGAATEVPSEAWLWKFYQAEFPDVPVTAQVHGGPVWQRIVETAAVEKADLIVMATRGHDSLADRMIGSNTERVVRHAPCPVLVV